MAEDAKPGVMLFDARITVKELFVLAALVLTLVGGYMKMSGQIQHIRTVQEIQMEQFKEFRNEIKQELKDRG